MQRRLRALIFDDDASIRQLVEGVLKRRGYEVFSYGNPGLCPLEHAHECRCGRQQLCADIVITDIDMPSVSGLDFLEEQIRKGCKIRSFAVMSGGWSEKDKKRAQRLGCAVFEKPVALSTLEAWFDKCAARADQGKDLSNWFCEGNGNCSRFAEERPQNG